MKVELNINNLNTLLSALSIGIVFLNNQHSSLLLGCNRSSIIEDLFEKYEISDEEKQLKILKDRFNELKDIYMQLLEVEKLEKRRN